MKWIGQHIYDLISRFRSDVYLEDISTGTIASGGHLGLDSNNKIVKAADGGGDLTSIVAGTGLSGTDLTGPIPTINIDAAQPTVTSLGTLTALDVDNININGDTITASGDMALVATGNDISVDTDNFVIESATSGKPLVTIKATNTTASTSGELKFLKDAADVATGEYLGEIGWYGDNNAGTPEEIQYARILTRIGDITDGQEAGNMFFQVASYDGVLTSGLQLLGDTNADGEVDVTIGAGAASTTTIAGELVVTGETISSPGRLRLVPAPGNDILFDGGISLDGDVIENIGTLKLNGVGGTIELGHATDTTIARASAGVVTIEGVNVAMQSLRIKLIPTSFMADDSGRPLLMDDTGQASENFFVESNASATVYASVDIPTGYKATHIMVHGSATDAIECWEMQINSKTGVSKGTGNVDTEINITDVTSSTTNYLLIQVANASGNEIHGGYVTIAVA